MPTARAHLTSLALSLGFDVAGWANAAPVPADLERYRGWLDSGRQAGMNSLTRQLPRRRWPGSPASQPNQAAWHYLRYFFKFLPSLADLPPAPLHSSHSRGTRSG